MDEIRFLQEIPMDKGYALDQLLGRFQSVEHGLPELLKNAKDQYSRVGITEKEERVIVVAVNRAKHSIGVIDFAGASPEDFKAWWKWSDRRSSQRAEAAPDIESGHGNGGKAFMVRGSSTISFFDSCVGGKRTKMGFKNDDPERRHFPAFFIEDGQEINDVEIEDPRAVLDKVLSGLAIRFDSLPEPAKKIFTQRRAFTIVQVNGIKDWDNKQSRTIQRKVDNIPDKLMNHGQAALTIETCLVLFMVNGKIVGNKLKTEYPEPMPGFEDLPKILIPNELIDPEDAEKVPTGSGDEENKYFQLHTSKMSLRTTVSKALNVIRVRNDRNIVANWKVADLVPRPESANIYGEVHVPDLKGDHLTGADRMALSDTPLVRALQEWVAKQVDDLSTEIQRKLAKSHKPKDQSIINQGLEKLRDLMREFLEDSGGASDGSGEGSTGGGEKGEEPKGGGTSQKEGSKIHEIVLEQETLSIAMAAGTKIPIIVRAYEMNSSGKRLPLRNPRLNFKTDSMGGLSFTAEGLLKAERPGKTKIWFVDTETGVESNHVIVESVKCKSARIENVPERPLLQGERVRLRPVFETSASIRRDLLIEASIDEVQMGRINRHGLFTAGTQEGSVTIRVKFKYTANDVVTCQFEISPEKIRKVGTGGDDVGAIPLILLCGTDAPGMSHYPPEQRTIQATEHQPTIIDCEPVFENVIFINPDSAESIQVREGEGGPRGPATIGNKTFMQFLSLKCFDILKRLWVRQEIKYGKVTEMELRQHFASAETSCAPFIKQAYSVARDLTDTWSKTHEKE